MNTAKSELANATATAVANVRTLAEATEKLADVADEKANEALTAADNAVTPEVVEATKNKAGLAKTAASEAREYARLAKQAADEAEAGNFAWLVPFVDYGISETAWYQARDDAPTGSGVGRAACRYA